MRNPIALVTRELVRVVGIFLAAFCVGGCASTTSPSAVRSTTPRASATAAAEQNPGFTAARAQWMAGADPHVIAADQGAYWETATTDLKAGETTDTMAASATGKARYDAAIGELHELTGLPDAMLTASQMAAENRDVSALNAFFGTSGAYSS